MPNAPTRAEAVRSDRRRRRDDTVNLGLKLGVSPKFLDPNFNYRWLNDDGGRIEQTTTMDDYDLVDDPSKVGKPDADGLGGKVRKVVGKSDTGGPLYAYLARKPIDFYREDQSRKADSIKKTMDAIRMGTPPIEGASVLGDKGYVPGGPTGISIKDERQ
jgi:hypothetical protein